MNANTLPPTTWTTGTTAVFKTGTWRAALPRHIAAPSPCHAACPVDGEIAQWIGRARDQDFRGAWELLVRNNPFPAVAGRICHHPCEAACNRAGFDEPLAICKLERHVGDLALAHDWQCPPPDVERVQRVAVVGGGPSGLSAAFQLRRRGYQVTIFEAAASLGGLMRDGIPAYRLPRDVLDGEIARMLRLGVEVRCGEAIASPGDFARLRQRFDAVYLAIGARRSKRLPQLDYDQPWVADGADWLARANAGAPPALGRRMVVVGGGSAAIDVARSARRAGHEVTLLALEARAQMPAQGEEVEEAIEEGVRLADASMLVRAHRDGDDVVLECVRVDFEAAADGRAFAVRPRPGSEFRVAADAIVSSIGQDPDLGVVDDALRTQGALVHVDSRQATSEPRVFAGGDVASMARFVTEAIGMGKRAALAIDRALQSNDAPPAQAAAPSERIVPLDAIATFYYPAAARAAERRLDTRARLDGDAEVQLGFSPEEALAEAQRCFSCGSCIFCDNCYHYCPDLAVGRVPGGYTVDADYCKGCGVCVRECPTGSMEMVEEAK
jgi:NADPH-dependent glutamate synthase beta subunit-like oxidoreductase